MKENKKWYQSISNIVLLIACIILVPILLINIWIIAQSKINPDEIPSVFGFKPFIVLTGSMETEIYKGDLVISKVVDPSTLKVDDIIAFRDAENTVTTHRIIDIVEDDGVNYFITKGDNNNTQDQNLVEYQDVEGLYVMRIPGFGSMMNSLAEPMTVLVIFLVISLAFIIGFTISSRRQREQERKEFLEYKKMKEEEEKKKEEESKTKKTKSIKAEKTSAKKSTTKKVTTTKKKEAPKKSTTTKKTTKK